jgi:anti-sigma factor RsiW
MDCHKAQETLWLFVEGALSAAEAQSIQGHIEACAGCRTELAAIRATRGALASADALEPSSDFHHKLAQRIDAWEVGRDASWMKVVTGAFRRHRRLIAASCATFVLALFGGLYVLHFVAGPSVPEGRIAGEAPTSYEGIASRAAQAESIRQDFIMRDIPYGTSTVSVTRRERADTVYTQFPTREFAPARGLQPEDYVIQPVATPVRTGGPVF